jgi:ketosteroid isomerase-like protein
VSRFLTVCIFMSLSVNSLSADAKSVGDSIKAVRSKFTAFNLHYVAAIKDIYSSDAMLNSPDYHDLVGNKPIAETYKQLFESIPDAEDNVQLLELAGEHVYVQFVLTGHWNGSPDKPVNVRIISVYKVSDGHIVDDATYYDRKAP